MQKRLLTLVIVIFMVACSMPETRIYSLNIPGETAPLPSQTGAAVTARHGQGGVQRVPLVDRSV